MRPRERAFPRRAMVVLGACTALLVICKHLSVTEILSGHNRTERAAALIKMVAGIQVSGWRTALVHRLANARSLIPVYAVPSPKHLDLEVRKLRLYHVHTRESLTVTYKRDGRYIPAAMAQLNYFLRDWRTNTVASMSGETIDLLWELHHELGSKQPINVICGFRSAQTNALLRHIGRQVATKSEHLLGRAIDVQFPDVPLKSLRNKALSRQAGGVGYYPAGRGSFIHIDSGRVRHWPIIGRTELAEIFGDREADRDGVVGF